MTRVAIASFETHLADHLDAVRRGETIVLLDGDEPIARMVPVGPAGPGLGVRPAGGTLQEVELLGPCPSATDVLDQLGEERQERPS